MNRREGIMAVLHCRPYEHMPVVSFGYWPEPLQKWAEEGRVAQEEADRCARFGDNSAADRSVVKKPDVDFNRDSCIGARTALFPAFEPVVLEEKPDGSRIMRDCGGLIVRVVPGAASIPSEVGTSLTDREAWETRYLPELQRAAGCIPRKALENLPKPGDRDIPIGLHLGSLIGGTRNLLGVQELSCLYADDEELYCEIADTVFES